jgi:hypothetical protein
MSGGSDRQASQRNERRGDDMSQYKFEVAEVSRNGYIDWDLLEPPSRTHRILAHSPMEAGKYPEVERHLQSQHSVALSPPLAYFPSLGDVFDQSSQTWTFRRNGHVIIVSDIPRTILSRP